MEARPVYAHWLSTEYSKPVTWGSKATPRQLARSAADLLKLYALFGVNIVASEAQALHSPVLLFLFQNAGFRSFLEANPDFLGLRAKPSQDSWHNSRDRVIA